METKKFTSKLARIITPGTNVVKAYRTSYPQSTDEHIYYLYYDYYMHVVKFDNDYVNVRIGKENCWIKADSIEELTFDAKIIRETDIYSQPDEKSEIVAHLSPETDVKIIDYNVNKFSEIYFDGKTGFVLADNTNFNFKTFTGANDGEIAVKLVRSRKGCGYEWAMCGPKTFDCSGLMQWTYNRLDIFIPRCSFQQAESGIIIKDKKDLLPGDLITFYTNPQKPGKVSHVVMYAGDGKFLHESSKYNDVMEVELDSYSYQMATMNRYWDN